MHDFSRIDQARNILDRQRMRGRRVGFVPTMGNIHAGHLKLLERCRAECHFSVASIFVNPLQFGPNEDFADYPRTLERDRELLTAAGCDLLLRPAVEDVYGEDPQSSTRVYVPELSERLCGAARPGHFDGVATVMTLLLNYVRPDVAYLGLKDYQQYLIIRKLVADLGMELHVEGVGTVREADGLAISSRNTYLSPAERRAAPELYRCLQAMARRIVAGERDYADIAANADKDLTAAGFRMDYIEICHAGTLRPAAPEDTELVILAAAFLGRTRLIDNLRLAIEPKPAA